MDCPMCVQKASLITYLRTTTLFTVAASISILSTPTPARPTTFNLPLEPEDKTSDVIFVSDRTIIAS